MPVLAHPGLQGRETGAAVRLFAAAEEARAATRGGLARLFESALRYDLGWLEKDLRGLRALGPLAVTLAPLEQLQADALVAIRRWVCEREVRPLHQTVFRQRLEEAKGELRGLVPRLTDWLRETLALRLALQTHAMPYPGLEEELVGLLPADFLRQTPFGRVKDLPRYLKAKLARAERWKRDPVKDAQRAAEVAPFAGAAQKLGPAAGDFRWLVEEFRVSLFAQELGTAGPVSAVRLERARQEISAGRAAGAEGVPAKAKPVLSLPVKGRTRLKSLDALGNLPR